MTHGEPDFTKRSNVIGSQLQPLQQRATTYDLLIQLRHLGVEIDPRTINHWWIKGVELIDPTVAACLPMSIENPAIAYDQVNDRFKVDIEAMSVGTIDVNVTDKWARQLGLVDLSRVLGAALSHSNPVISRLTNGTAFIDPRDRSWTITESLARSWNLGASDVPDLSDRAARLLGKVYGNQDVLQQRATSKELIVQIQHQGTEKDPTAIRALTSSDVVTVADINKTATPKQISNVFAGAGEYTFWTPAAGKKVRLKLLSLELSAAVNLSLRLGTGGTDYYIRSTAGPYAANLIGANIEGSADQVLILYASGACTVKGYALGEEI